MGTTNGGLSWAAQNPPLGTSRLNAVSCPSTADCFAVGANSVLSSVNAGYAWTPDGVPAEVSGLNGISCATSSDCTAVGFGIFGSPVAIGTTDGGRTWTAETVPAGVGVLTGVSCVSASVCHAVSDFNSPTDSPPSSSPPTVGSVWSSETFPGTVSNFTAISCVDSHALHGCRFVFGRPRSSDPQHHERWQHLDTTSRSVRDHPQRHLLLVRDDVPGDRIPRDRNLERRIKMERPGSSGWFDCPDLRQLYQLIRLHGGRWVEHPQHV